MRAVTICSITEEVKEEFAVKVDKLWDSLWHREVQIFKGNIKVYETLMESTNISFMMEGCDGINNAKAALKSYLHHSGLARTNKGMTPQPTA